MSDPQPTPAADPQPEPVEVMPPPRPVPQPPLPENTKVYRAAFHKAAPIPIPIVVEVEADDGTVSEEEHLFYAVGDAGAGGMLAVSGLVRYDPKGRQIADLNAIKAFLERCLVEGDYDRFLELLDRRDVTIDFDVLGEIFNDLLQEYSGRGPTPPSTSPAVRRFTGR